MNFEEFKNRINKGFPEDSFDENFLKHFFVCACVLRQYDAEQDEIIREQLKKQ